VSENAHQERKTAEEGTSTPVDQSLPLRVNSHNAIRQPFTEDTTTLQISCHGCRFRSKQFILKGTRVTLELPRPGPGHLPHWVSATVVHNRRPEARGESFEVDVAFEVPENVWGIAFPPEDWRPFTKVGSRTDLARVGTRALEGHMHLNETHGQPSEKPHVVPRVSQAERSAGVPESFEVSRHDGVSARPAEVEQQVACFPPTLAKSPPVQTQFLKPEVLPQDAASQASADLKRESQAAVRELKALADQFKSDLQEWVTEAGNQCMGRLEGKVGSAIERCDSFVDATLKTTGDRLSARQTELTNRLIADGERQLSAHTSRLGADVDAFLATAKQRLQVAGDEASRISIARILQEMERQTKSKMELLREAEQRLAASQKHLDESLHAASDRAREAADQCVGSVASELAEIVTRARTDLLEATSSTVQKQIERLNSESTEVTQTTFDSLHKAAEWCHGKAQAGIQGHLEKTLEGAAASLQEKAAEECQLFASALDQYSRSFVTQTKRSIEESATEQVENSREQLKHNHKEIQASFEASLRHFAGEYRRHLEDLTAVTLGEAKVRVSEIIGEQDSQFRINATQGVANFQQQLTKCAAMATEEAVRGLESRFSSLLETMRKETEGQHAVWNERHRNKLDESIAQFRQNLENVSNSWRAATVALLMQDSQRLMDKLGAGVMHGLQQSAAKGCIELARILKQKSIAPATSLEPSPPEKEDTK
jgi:hypothetical protein